MSHCLECMKKPCRQGQAYLPLSPVCDYKKESMFTINVYSGRTGLRALSYIQVS